MPSTSSSQPLPALHQAVITGDLAKVKSLITQGADINQLDPHMGNSPAHIAAQTDHTHILRYLLDHGAFINLQAPRSGFTPLMIAAWYSKPENIKLLFSYAELNIELKTPAGAKAENMVGGWDNHIEPREAKRYSKLAELFTKKRKQQSNLLSQQKILNTVEDKRLSEAERVDKIALLVTQGQDVDQRRPVYSNRNDWHTPLVVAAREGYAKIVKLLLENDADQTITGYPMDAIAFHKAAYMGRPEVIELLLADKRAATVLNAQGPNNGYTPLHDAIWHGNIKAARALIKGGAKLNLTTYEQDTPLELAKRYEYFEIIKFLEN